VSKRVGILSFCCRIKNALVETPLTIIVTESEMLTLCHSERIVLLESMLIDEVDDWMIMQEEKCSACVISVLFC